jgi:hypothetical protein
VTINRNKIVEINCFFIKDCQPKLFAISFVYFFAISFQLTLSLSQFSNSNQNYFWTEDWKIWSTVLINALIRRSKIFLLFKVNWKLGKWSLDRNVVIPWKSFNLLNQWFSNRVSQHICVSQIFSSESPKISNLSIISKPSMLPSHLRYFTYLK